MNYSRITSEVGMVMKRPPVMISLSGRVPGRASEPSWARVGDGGHDGTFRGWRLGYLGFSRSDVFIGGRARSVGARGATPCLGAARGWAAPTGGVATSWLGSISPLDSVFVTVK